MIQWHTGILKVQIRRACKFGGKNCVTSSDNLQAKKNPNLTNQHRECSLFEPKIPENPCGQATRSFRSGRGGQSLLP
jgi:hypothetical protein